MSPSGFLPPRLAQGQLPRPEARLIQMPVELVTEIEETRARLRREGISVSLVGFTIGALHYLLDAPDKAALLRKYRAVRKEL